jgi:hypothetical protein
MQVQEEFYGQLVTTDPRGASSIYIQVLSNQDIRLYTAPPPFDFPTLVGHFGPNWQIKRIKRGWFNSVFMLTFIQENARTDVEYRTKTKFGDKLAAVING